MTRRQWYTLLLILNQDYSTVTDNITVTPLLSEAELASPDTDWSLVWRRVRLPCLGSEASSLVWRIIHGTLPSEKRVAEITNKSAICRFNCHLLHPQADLRRGRLRDLGGGPHPPIHLEEAIPFYVIIDRLPS